MTFPIRGHHTPRRKVNITISSNQTDFVLADYLIANHKGAGVIWAADIYITVNAGVVINGSTTAIPAFRTGDLFDAPGNSGSTFVYLTNNGRITGAGGKGGAWGGNNGGGGGSAIFLAHNMTIDNFNGEVYGGGGGGGGGGGSQGGGGGGGAGTPGGDNGSGGTGANPGGFGTALTGGLGGTSGLQNPNNARGGNGGNIGQNGQPGAQLNPAFPGGSGGLAGFYEIKNGFTLTWINNGIRAGRVS